VFLEIAIFSPTFCCEFFNIITLTSGRDPLGGLPLAAIAACPRHSQHQVPILFYSCPFRPKKSPAKHFNLELWTQFQKKTNPIILERYQTVLAATKTLEAVFKLY
jgi:hypothetical protein